MLVRIPLLVGILVVALASGVEPSVREAASQEIATGIQEDEFSLRVEPENPMVGEHFDLVADLRGRGGQSKHSLTLVDVDPEGDGQPNVVLEQNERSEWMSSVSGARWRMYAEQAGRVTLSDYGYYEKAFFCDELEDPFPGCNDFTSFVGDTRMIEVDIQPNPDLRPNADANDDGDIDSLDALWVLQDVAGLLPQSAGIREAATVAEGDLIIWAVPASPSVGDHVEVTIAVPSDDEDIGLELIAIDTDPDGDGEENVILENPERGAFPAPTHARRFYLADEGPATFRGTASNIKLVTCDDPDPPTMLLECPYNFIFMDTIFLTVDVRPADPRLNGDANGDGRVGAVDAALILQYVAGLIPSPSG